ncbi:P22 coat protein - protein 5 domain protein [Streptomyces sp. SID14515]|uniref:phage major capsid protein n=1 Tax=Streptomyces sp. SID14515 TaxID=2706074 RepID=UPI0013CB1897|nr:P22 coat protein - protein 5 domain protein [Streptomyces sp. SID14515]NEB42264.1 P22 coat protein - protein 5 domain protein [Streptomyces sp. SID14515]
MSVALFKPQIWSAQILAGLDEALVYAQPQIVNRDYEGEITSQGQSVRIVTIGDPSIFPYKSGDTINYEDIDTAGLDLPIDQGDAFAFKLDDVDKAQVALNPMAKTTQRAARKLAAQADRYVASLYTGVAPSNVVGSSGSPVNIATNPKDAWDKVLIPLRTKLNRANVPGIDRYVVVSPEFTGALLQDDRFVRVDASGNEQGLRNGIVGRAAGFDVLESNVTPNPSSDTQVIQAGYPGALTFVDQILETEALRLESTIADAVRGLHVYGAKLIRPEGIAVAYVDPSA